MNWIKVSDRPPDCKKVLAICKTDKEKFYNLCANGWFHDTIYSCWIHEGEFVIESHGPVLPATHWMPAPPLPKDDE